MEINFDETSDISRRTSPMRQTGSALARWCVEHGFIKDVNKANRLIAWLCVLCLALAFLLFRGASNDNIGELPNIIPAQSR